jgi:Common central domain of tyrosinase
MTPIIQPVIVKPHEKCESRKNIYDVMNPVRDKGDEIAYQRALKRRDLFLQAFERLMQKDHRDMRSYYQIAGIHGLPYDPYDGVDPYPGPPNSKFWGYCAHGSTLFPTWHRIYLLLFEQELVNCALELLDDPDIGHVEDKCEAREIAKEIRLPYWDWADFRTQAYGVPKYFTDAKVEVKFPSERKFANPLSCYILPVDLVPDNRIVHQLPDQIIPQVSR